jgi:uncharacterized protein YecT (DUF1311 family)
MKDLIPFALGILCSAAGVLILRWLRKDRLSEELARKKQALELHEKLQEQNISLEQLDAFEKSLLQRRNQVRKIEDKLYTEAISEADPTAHMNQQEMNIYAANRADEMDLKLGKVVDELQTWMHTDEKQAFTKAHEAWLQYRANQAEFASLQFEGGSMQPFILFGERSRLTIERMSELTNELEFRRDTRA